MRQAGPRTAAQDLLLFPGVLWDTDIIFSGR